MPQNLPGRWLEDQDAIVCRAETVRKWWWGHWMPQNPWICFWEGISRASRQSSHSWKQMCMYHICVSKQESKWVSESLGLHMGPWATYVILGTVLYIYKLCYRNTVLKNEHRIDKNRKSSTCGWGSDLGPAMCMVKWHNMLCLEVRGVYVTSSKCRWRGSSKRQVPYMLRVGSVMTSTWVLKARSRFTRKLFCVDGEYVKPIVKIDLHVPFNRHMMFD